MSADLDRIEAALKLARLLALRRDDAKTYDAGWPRSRRRRRPMHDDWLLIVTMPDGSDWAYPVMEIARHRAEHYAGEFGGDVERSLREDTLPLFREDPYEIEDWASNNMNEEDVPGTLYAQAPSLDKQDGWVNGAKRVEGGDPDAAE